MMRGMQIDAVLARYGPPPTNEIPAWLTDARATMRTAVDGLLGLAEEDLPRRWWWRDDREGGAEARFAFFRSVGALERAAADAARAVDSGASAAARGAFAAATVARWDLHGLLAGLADADLDGDPGGGEWTVRQTLAHTVNVERAYASFTAWWLTREPTPELPRTLPDEVGEGFPEEETEGVGTLADIRGRLDTAMDGAAERMGGLDESQLALPARWAGYAVDVGYRLWRQSAHIQEHTVQVEKTLVMIGRTPPEAERLARLVLRAYGRLEAVVYAMPEAHATPARQPLEAAVAEVAEIAAHVRAPGSLVSEDG
jgi:hypothetical protein